MGGDRIRPKKLPPRLGHKSELAANTWLTAMELKALARQVMETPGMPPPPTAPIIQVPLAPTLRVSPSIPSIEEVIERAKKLYALGNPPSQIKTILAGSRAAPEAVAAAMAEVTRFDRQKRQSSQRAVGWVMGVFGLVLVVLVGGGALMALRPASQSPIATARFNSPPTSAPGNGFSLPSLPDLSAILPNGAAATVAAQPTTAVQRGVGPGISKCPGTPRAAAELFGGEAEDWSQSPEFGGSWVLIAKGPAVTVQVPSNMSAGYFVLDNGLQMLSVLGPATLSNINFVTISCEQ